MVKDEEKSENDDTRFEVRLLREPADASEAHKPPGREEAGVLGEEDTQGPSVANTQGGGHSQEGAGEPQGSLYPSDSHVSKETKTQHSERSDGEDGEEDEGERYQKRERGERGSEGKRVEEPGETQNAFLNNIHQATANGKEEIPSGYNTHSARMTEEETHSRERGSRESGEETGNQEKQLRESKSQPSSQEDSEDSEEDASPEVDKRLSRPRHHHGQSSTDRSSQEGYLPSEERGHPHEEAEEANVGMASFGDKGDRHPTHYRASEEESEYGEEVRSYPGVQAPKNPEGGRYGGRGSEEYRSPRLLSDEGQEEEDKRNRPNSELDNRAPGYRDESEEEKGTPEWGYHHGARGREPAAYSTAGKEEKRFLGQGRYQLQENQMDKARRHPKDAWEEQARNEFSDGEEGPQGKWQQQKGLQDTRLQGKQYAAYHTTEKRKRLGELLSPYYAPSQWKNSRLERKDSMGDGVLEGEEENGLTFNEKNFFPEYNYDWWEKKPFEEDGNWGYDKRTLAPKLDLKRQYDRVAELDQLLHYRKKSAEFPDFYDSEEPTGPRGGKARAGPGALTEEEVPCGVLSNVN